MKGMPLPFEFEGKGELLLDQQEPDLFVPSANRLVHFENLENQERKYINSLIGEEPTSVLDNINSSPSPPTSTSTLSSSLGGGGVGGGGGGDTAGVAAVSGNPSSKWPLVENQETSSSNVDVELHHHQLQQQSLEITGGTTEKCGAMEDWESVLAEPGQEQAILRWIMGDVEDPSLGLNRVLQGGGGGGGGGSTADFEFNGGFGVVDQGFGLDANNPGGQIGNFSQIPLKFSTEKIGLSQSPQHPTTAAVFGNHHKLSNSQNPMFSPLNDSQMLPFDIKPQLFNPQLLVNQHQSQPQQNPAFFLPLEQQLLMPPQAKRHNPGSIESNTPMPKNPFLDSGQNPHQLLQQRPPPMAVSKKMAAFEELGTHHHHQQQQMIIEQLFKAADLIQSGNNPVLAQGILARLNHQLSPIGKPFYRAAFYFKEALQLLVHSILNNINPPTSPIGSPFSLIFKIGAYKSFSEISPFVQFANFTCNQALLEVLDGFDQIHIIDFDIGYGGQWASLMQELALRINGSPSLKITAFASPSTHDQLELGLTRENLIHFASEINVGFEFDILNIDVLASASWSLPFHDEAIAVNLPIDAISNYQIPLPLVLRFVKSLSPRVVVSVDRGCDRTDLPFSNHVIHALQSYSNLLESLDAVNMNLDALQKIERFLLQPSIEKIIMRRYRLPEKTQHWRALFLSAGFSPLTFSNFTESQAECVVKRTPVRGFHVEKRQSSLVLCWQRRELVSASAWRC